MSPHPPAPPPREDAVDAPTWWRSLDAWSSTPAFRAWADEELPRLAREIDGATSLPRRRFLQMMAASMALAGLSGCGGRREHHLVPYAEVPPEVVPGRALYYASTLVMEGDAVGVLVETHEGRPTKLEGNPLHPTSGGALSARAQARLLDLYDPDRSRHPRREGRPVAWKEDVEPMLAERREALAADEGAGLAVLVGEPHAPSLDRLRRRLAERLPRSTWHVRPDPRANRDAERLVGRARLDLGAADVVLCLDADPLGIEERGVAHARAFGGRRDPEGPAGMSRLYVVESHWTVMGMAADHRLPLPASRIVDHAARVAAALEDEGPLADLASAAGPLPGVDPAWVDEVARDLGRAGSRALVVAGHRQPPAVHALARRMNERLGSVGTTVRYEEAPGDGADAGFDALLERLRADEVDTLVIVDENVVYDAPADVDVAGLLDRAAVSIHIGERHDETAAACTWHLPRAHPLERWGDARQGDVLSAAQPVIAPLFGGRTALEVLGRLLDEEVADDRALVRETFAQLTGTPDAELEDAWRAHLNRGMTRLEDGDAPAAPALEADAVADLARPALGRSRADGLEVVLALDASVYDGRHANNGWLQETPDPVTKLTWDNAALLAPTTARRLGVETGDEVRIQAGGRSVTLPAFVLPGAAPDSVALALGYGRKAGGSLARHAGTDVGRLRTREAPWILEGATVRATGGRRPLATTQDHGALDTHELVENAVRDRGIVREGTLATYEADPDFAAHQGIHGPPPRDVYDTPEYEGAQQWGMSIDLSRCTGCNACVVACQAENNIPIVGKDEVLRGREMAWIRIDRYFRGADPEGEVEVANQPMLCQHCENAPCEPVCPVNATTHDDDGLNVMTYNRCVGTRYCANNCPYKVRRFNFLDYNKESLREGDAGFDGSSAPDPFAGLTRPQAFQPDPTELSALQRNPDVTVRMRGVMEKCTYCVQRIQRAKIDAKAAAGQDGPGLVPDGGIRTACQQSCPTQAIVFGDVADETTEVSRARRDPRTYRVLENLNTQPRTTYKARLRNRNPAMPLPAGTAGGEASGGHG